MGKLKRLMSLPPARRRRVAGAWVLLVKVRLGLWVLPFSRVTHRLEVWAARRIAAREVADPHELAWAVRAASRGVPGGGHCLTQALAARALLRRHGYEARLHIGVSREGVLGFAAHAWVELDGEVLIGDADLDRYQVLESPRRADAE